MAGGAESLREEAGLDRKQWRGVAGSMAGLKQRWGREEGEQGQTQSDRPGGRGGAWPDVGLHPHCPPSFLMGNLLLAQ